MIFLNKPAISKNSSKVSTFKIAATYIGTVVGAGFATGQEVLQFFAAFGNYGLFGIAVATILFILFGYIIMSLGYKLYAKSHLEVIKHCGGKVLGRSMDLLITFFLFGSLTAMLAGTGALFAQQFGIPAFVGNILMVIITAITVMAGINGVINSISVIVPFLLISVVGISLFSVFSASPNTSIEITINGGNGLIRHWLWSAVLYVSYNTVVSTAILAPLGAAAKNEKVIFRGSLLGGLGLGLGMLAIFLALRGEISTIQGLEVPLIQIAGNIGRTIAIIYAIVLIAEVYTTAVGSMFGFSARLNERLRYRKRTIIITTGIAALLASFFGFSNLVKILYPLVGYGGIVLLICLLWNWRKKI